MNTQQLRMVTTLIGEGGTSVLTTCGSDGMPHATWMNAVVIPGLREVIAITSPESRKPLNLGENAQAEWMFTSPSLETIAYLSGTTTIVADDESEKYWDMVPCKAKGFYRHYRKPESHTDFAVIRTIVSNVKLLKPMGYRKTEMAFDEVALSS